MVEDNPHGNQAHDDTYWQARFYQFGHEVEAAAQLASLPPLTTAKEWARKAEARWLVALPSGVSVKARRPDWSRLIRQGVIAADELLKAVGESNLATYQRSVPLAIRLMPHIVTEPTIVLANGTTRDLTDEVVSVEKLPEIDIMALFGWANGRDSAVTAIELLNE